MTILQAFKTLTSAVLTSGVSVAQSHQTQILASAHIRLTAPLAAQAASVIGESIPGGGFPWSELADALRGKLPAFEAQLTQALDTRVQTLLTWGLATVQKIAKDLES